MNHYGDRIWVLITRELSGEASVGEKKELREWLAEDSDHKAFFEDIKSSWQEVPEGSVDSSFLFSRDSGLQKLRGKLKADRRNIPESGLERVFVHDRKKRLHRDRFAWKVAAAVLLMIVSGSVFASLYFWEHPVVSYATAGMEQRILTLPDGSTVRLNQNSRIEFPEDFAGKTREILLDGEAFFDVTRNPDRPFVVRTETAVVRVLGTSFNVKEGDREDVMVAVRDGLVSVRHHSSEESVELSEGQLGLVSQQRSIVDAEETGIENYLSWMSGHLSFDRMPFDQVTRQLERLYGIRSKFEVPDLESLFLTIYTERLEQDEVLNTIALALNLTYEIERDHIVWSVNDDQ